MMINKRWYKRTARFVLVWLFFQLITQKIEGMAIPLVIALPEMSVYVTGIAGALAAYKYMPDMSTSMDEIARTMHDKLDGKWHSYIPHNPMSPAYQEDMHLLDLDTDFVQLKKSFEQPVPSKTIETFFSSSSRHTLEVPRTAQQLVDQSRAFNYTYATNPQFKQAADSEVARCMHQLEYLNHADLATRSYARLMLAYEHFQLLPYQEDFSRLKMTLLKYCFDRKGNLFNVEQCNGMQQEICAFIKTLPKQYHHYQANFAPIAQVSEGSRIHKFGDIVSSVVAQQSNQEIKRVIELSKQGNFVDARHHAMKVCNPIAERLYRHGVDALLEKCRHDPWVRSLSPADKALLMQDPVRLSKLCYKLVIRSELKHALCRAWDIPASAPQVVHDAVYKLCDLNEKGDLYFAQNHINDRLHSIITDASEKDHSTLVRAFYLPNGLLKDRARHPGAKLLEMSPAILQSAYAEQRKELNKLFFIEQLTHSEIERKVAFKGIECIKQGLLAKDAILQQKYFGYAHEVYNGLLSQRSEKQKELLTQIERFQRTEYYEKNVSSQIRTAFKEFDGMHNDGFGDQSTKPKGSACAGGGGSPPPNDPRGNKTTASNIEPPTSEIEKQGHIREFKKLGFQAPGTKFTKHVTNKHYPDGA